MPKHLEPRLIKTAIVEILEKKQGTSTTEEIMKALREVSGDVSQTELNIAMMKLDVSGIIRVSRLTGSKKRVELARRAM